jgi:hypothetical protein
MSDGTAATDADGVFGMIKVGGSWRRLNSFAGDSTLLSKL